MKNKLKVNTKKKRGKKLDTQLKQNGYFLWNEILKHLQIDFTLYVWF